MIWLIFGVIAAIVGYVYVQWSAERDFNLPARIESDREFRSRRSSQLTQKILTANQAARGDTAAREIVNAYAERGRCHYFAGDWEAAIRDAESAAARAERDGDILAELAEYYLLANRLPEAVAAIERGFQVRNLAHDHALAARVFLTVGDYARAENELRVWRELQRRGGEKSHPANAAAKFIEDPAIEYYEILLDLLRDKRGIAEAVAAAEIFCRTEICRDCWEMIFLTRLFAISSPSAANLNLPDYAENPAVAAAHIEIDNFDDNARRKIHAARENMYRGFLPQTLTLVCASETARDMVADFLAAGREREIDTGAPASPKI